MKRFTVKKGEKFELDGTERGGGGSNEKERTIKKDKAKEKKQIKSRK